MMYLAFVFVVCNLLFFVTSMFHEISHSRFLSFCGNIFIVYHFIAPEKYNFTSLLSYSLLHPLIHDRVALKVNLF